MVHQHLVNGLVREHRIASSIPAEPFGLPEGFVLLRLGQASSHGTIKAIQDSRWTPVSVAAIVAIGKFQTVTERKVFAFSPVQSRPAASSLGPPPPWQIGATNGGKGFIVDDRQEGRLLLAWFHRHGPSGPPETD